MPAQDAVVVVTGGSSGIGLAVARELLGRGAKGVVITGRSKTKLDGVVEQLTAEFGKDRILGIPCDATSWEDNVNVMKVTNDTFGLIDYVFANALAQDNSPFYTLFSNPDYIPSASMLTSVSYTTHAAIPYLSSSTSDPVKTYAERPKDGPGRDRGVFLTGSEAAFVGMTAQPTYAAAKGGMASMVWALKERMEQIGVRINLLAPGWVDTAAAAESIKLGIVRDDDLIPMKTIVDAFMRFVDDTSLSGVVTRVRGPLEPPFDTVAVTVPSAGWVRWGPLIEQAENGFSA